MPQPDGSFRWEANLFWRFSDSSVESIFPDEDGAVWFGSSEELLRYDPRVARDLDPALPALVRRVIPKTNAKADWASPRFSVLPYQQNALRFEFALPSFDQESGNQFRVMLEGYERAWSPWISEAAKEYTNLPEGRYRFRVQGRNVYGKESLEGSFDFRILPPWYRAWWAYALYLPLGLGGLLLGFRFRTRLLEERNAELQQRVNQATLDLRERERMLAAQAGELSAVNADLQQLNLQLRDVNEEKNQFLGIVIHDLRNPLNSILLAAEMIGEAEDLSEAQAKSRLIKRSGTEMSHLIGRFLDIAALDSGRIRPEPEPLILGDLVNEMVERHQAHAQNKTITLKVALPPGPGLIWADPKFARAVFDNLLSNALKFSPPGTTVTVSATHSSLWTELSVQDAGPGISEEDQKKLFGRFVTLSARPTGGEKSIGLGLSIVKKLLDAMGAQIQVESELGKGSLFRVIFPSAPPED